MSEIKKPKLTQEEANLVERHKNLPFFDLDEPLSYFTYLVDYVEQVPLTNPRKKLENLAKAYFVGYEIKEKKYYIELNFNYCNGSYLNVNQFGVWVCGEKRGVFDGTKTQFTQDEIDEMQKDPRAKGLDLNELKTEVSEDELED